MTFLTASPFVERLGWVLVHSLWQFFIIAIAAAVVLRLMSGGSAVARYWLSLTALLMMVAAPVMTWVRLGPDATATPPRAASNVLQPDFAAGIPRGAGVRETENGRNFVIEEPSRTALSQAALPPIQNDVASPAWPEALQDSLSPWLPTLVAGWCLGVLAFAFRPILGWWTIRRLRAHGTAVAPVEVRTLAEGVAARLQLHRVVEIVQSSRVHVPMVVGALRPVILLPLGLVTGLPVAQLEAILAHELAHVRRHDYVINIAQTVVETLFFYHPAVWWLSSRVREERENCCDDLVIRCCESRHEYGRALLAVAELQGNAPALALGARDGSLLARIRRLLCDPAEPRSGRAVTLIPMVVLMLLVTVWLVGQSVSASNDSIVETPLAESEVQLEKEREAWAALRKMRGMHADLSSPVKHATFFAVPPEVWPHIGQLTSLREISFSGSVLTREHARILSQLTSLESLSVVNGSCQPEFLAELATLTNLERLDVMFTVFELSEQERREQLGTLTPGEESRRRQYLAEHPDHEHIIQAALLTDRAMPALAQLKKLRSLRLVNTFVTEAGLALLADLPAIEELDIGPLALGANASRTIGGFSNLKKFRYADADDADLAALAGLSQMEDLELFASGLTDAGVDHLLQQAALRKLAIRGCRLTDAGLLRLTALPRLQSLDVQFSENLTQEGVERFRQQKPECLVVFQESDRSTRKSKPAAALQSGLKAIKGRILDDAKQPVPLAEVGLQAWEWNRETLADDEFVAATIADEAGQFELLVPATIDPAKVSGAVWAIANGFLPTRSPYVTGVNNLVANGASVSLVRSRSTQLQLLDHLDAPAAGVRIDVTAQRLPESVSWPTPRSWAAKFSAVTDAQGRVQLPHVLPEALAGLRVTFPDRSDFLEFNQNFFLNVRPVDAAPQFSLKLPPNGAVRGRLTGESLGDAFDGRITLRTEIWPSVTSLPGVWGVVSVPVDAEGRFEATQVAVGVLHVVPFLSNDQPLRAEIPSRLRVQADQSTDFTIDVQRGTLVRGLVRKQDTKEPCPDVAYKLIYGASARDKSGMLDSFEIRTDADGHFSAYVPVGPIELRMTSGCRGYMSDEWWGPHKGYLGARYEVPAGQESFELEPIELVPEVPVTGQLVDADGKPLRDWTVYGYPDVPGKPRDEFRMNCVAGVSTDRNGKFEGHFPKTVPPAYWNVSHRDWPNPYVFDDKKWDAKILTQEPLVLQIDFRPPATGEEPKPEPAEPEEPKADPETPSDDVQGDVTATDVQPPAAMDPVVFDCDVRNKKTGERIRNAKVTWRIEAYNKDEPARKTLFEESFQSDESGRYQVRIPRSVIDEMAENTSRTLIAPDGNVRGLVWIEASHPDYLPVPGYGYPFHLPEEDAGIQPDHRHLQLQPGVEVTGRFVLPDGRPAANLTLMIARNREGFGDSTGKGFYTRTDADGRYRLVTKYDWPQRLHWFPEKHVNDSRALTKTFGDQGTIRLKNGPRLQGRIESHDGKPLEGMVIQAATGTRVPLLFAMSDADGQFAFAPSPAGEYHLLPVKHFVDLNGKSQVAPTPPPFDAVKFTLSDVSPPVVLRAPETITVRFRLMDGDGHPVAGRRIANYGWPPRFESVPVADQPGLYEVQVPKGQPYRTFDLSRRGGETAQFLSLPSEHSTITSTAGPTGSPLPGGHEIRLNLENRSELEAVIEVRSH